MLVRSDVGLYAGRYAIYQATLTLVPVSDQVTRAILAANQSTELYKKQYRWWKLLWMIPLFPIGSEHTTTVTHRDTIRSPQFYHDFFAAIQKSVKEKSELQPTAVPAVPQ